jgi:hypothetical protein
MVSDVFTINLHASNAFWTVMRDVNVTIYYRFSLHPGRHFEKTPSLDGMFDVKVCHQILLCKKKILIASKYRHINRVLRHGLDAKLGDPNRRLLLQCFCQNTVAAFVF